MFKLSKFVPKVEIWRGLSSNLGGEEESDGKEDSSSTSFSENVYV